jgi:hypothetical protein
VKQSEKQYLDGLLSAFDDLPDGAWAQCCQDAIRDDPRFKGRDPFEVWLAWCEIGATKER